MAAFILTTDLHRLTRIFFPDCAAIRSVLIRVNLWLTLFAAGNSFVL